AAHPGAHLLQRFEAERFDQLRQIEPLGIEPWNKRLEPSSPFGPRLRAQVLVTLEQQVVQPDEGRILALHLGADDLATEPLLQRVEAGRRAAMRLRPL